MRILHVISGLKSGGAEHFVLELCRQSLKDSGVEMEALTVGAADEISHKFHEAGITLLKTSPDKALSKTARAIAALRLLSKQLHDVFHAHMFHACVLACIAKIFRPSVQVIFTLHNDHVPQFHRQLILWLLKPLRKTDIIFPGMKRKWFQKKKTATVPTGIDMNRFETRLEKPRVFTCAFIGRLEEEKNPLFLVDVARSFRGEDFMITVAGDGPLRRTLEEKISSENLDGHFNILGYSDNVPSLLANSHCLLIPSLWEGMPLVLLEAAAAGIPVIATPVGAIPSLVSGNEGFVGEPGAFPDMIKNVKENYSAALVKAERLKNKMVQQFSIERSYAMHLDAYSH